MEISHRPAGAEGGMAGEGWPELAEQVFEALLTQTTVGFALLDADLRYVTLNEHLAQINGLPVEDHLGRSLSEVLPHFALVAEVPFREVLRTGSPMADLQFSAEVPGTGAVLRHWVESAYPVRDATGATAGIAVLVWEVTDRVEAERRREQMLGLLDVLIRQAPIGIAFLDPRLRYVRINENLAAANGRSVEEHLGRPLPEVVPGIAHQLVPPLEEVLSTGRPIIDAQLETPPMPAEPGRRRYWQISYYPVPSPVRGAPPEGVGIIVTDQTERVEAERERARLHEAERAARAAAEQAQARLDLLARASDLLGRSLDEGDVLAQLARLVVPDLADWLVVLMPDGRGRLVPRLSVHAGAASAAMAEAEAVGGSAALPIASDVPAATVFRSGRPLHTGDVRPYLLAPGTPASIGALHDVLGPSPGLLVPMVVRGRSVGVLSLVNTTGRADTLGADLELFADLARRAGVALDNARLFGQRTLIAARLQQSLLPERLPAVPGVEVAVRYATAEEAVDVGGDFYDLVAISPREHVVVVGDVSGRGVDAATVTGLARHTLRAVAHELSPARALARLGDVLHAQEAGERFVTAVVARLERTGPTALEVTLARGGHTYPVLVRASGDVSVLRSEGQLLGAFPGAVPQELVELLGPGDALVLYTDGITESRGHDELFGEERLAAVAAAHAAAGAEEMADAVLAAADAFRTGPAEDDVALLVLRFEGGDAPPRGRQ